MSTLPFGSYAGASTSQFLSFAATKEEFDIQFPEVAGEVIAVAVPETKGKSKGQFEVMLFAWAIMVCVCIGAAAMGFLDFAGIISVIHSVFWFFVSLASGLLAVSHHMRLKQLWQTR